MLLNIYGSYNCDLLLFQLCVVISKVINWCVFDNGGYMLWGGIVGVRYGC